MPQAKPLCQVSNHLVWYTRIPQKRELKKGDLGDANRPAFDTPEWTAARAEGELGAYTKALAFALA